MTNNQDKINQLQEKLENLLRRQNTFSTEINNLRIEISKMRAQLSNAPIQEEKISTPQPKAQEEPKIKKEEEIPEDKTEHQKPKKEPYRPDIPPIRQSTEKKSNLEKFIGENLINKIGIAITIIGIAIGAKYSIEHDLISPLTRIILGYLAGTILLGFGIKLKKKYEHFSAVLVSGAIATMYFMTYIAYGFYDLFPQILAFILMVIFTAFTIVAAINYNNQIIAHIGMVGAYAVPFLLGDGSGKVSVLFGYMTIINIGILIIAFKRYWKALYYSSFGLTWFIYIIWYVTQYSPQEQIGLALLFLTVFFVLFYLTFLAYKLLRKEKFETEDTLMLLFNSFIFYGMGYAILSRDSTGEQLLGAFTIFNAVVHFIVGVLLYKRKLADPNLLHIVIGLVLVFITIAIPVQLDGNWVTLLWITEAALLFWIGRTKGVAIYEKISYPLIFLAFFSIVQDWTISNPLNNYYEVPFNTPFINIQFLSALIFIAAVGLINGIHFNKKYPSAISSNEGLLKLLSFSLPAILIITIYCAFRIEISAYWSQLYMDSELRITDSVQDQINTYHNYDILKFKTIWIINYSLLFLALLAFINLKKIKNQQLGMITLGLIGVATVVFLSQGLYVLSELREHYLNPDLSEYYQQGNFYIGIRYVSYICVALALFMGYSHIQKNKEKNKLRTLFDFFLHISILWIASSELIHLLDLSDAASSYKLGLSILWGCYSLLLIALGIWKKKKHLRIGAIVLFGITLIKLFFYDIIDLNTIAKTIVFVSLGILLLIISFLYNKYKHIISDETDE